MKTSYIKSVLTLCASVCMLLAVPFVVTAQESNQVISGQTPSAGLDAAVDDFVKSFPDHQLAKAYAAGPEDPETLEAIRAFVRDNAEKIKEKKQNRVSGGHAAQQEVATEAEVDRRRQVISERNEQRVSDQRQREAELMEAANAHDAYMQKHKDDSMVKRFKANPEDAEAAEAVRKGTMLEYPGQFDLSDSERVGLAMEVETAMFREQFIQEMLNRGASQERAEYEYDKLPDSEKHDLIRKSLQEKGYDTKSLERGASGESPTLVPNK